MKVIIYLKKPFVKKVLKDVIHIHENLFTFGFGLAENKTFYINYSQIKKIKIKP